MADISKITLPSNDEYNIKDATARQGLTGKQDTITVNGILQGDGSGNITAAVSSTAGTLNNPNSDGTYVLQNTVSSGTSTLSWGEGGGDSLPSQSGNSGKFLTTNGTVASWADLPEEIFIATIDTEDSSNSTSYSEVLAAYQAGKICYVTTGYGCYLILVDYNLDNGYFYFAGSYNDVIYGPAIMQAWIYSINPRAWTYENLYLATQGHFHGNITNAGDITATAPTITNGDQLIINDDSVGKITNGPTFDGSTTSQFLSKKGTWETPTDSDENVKQTASTPSSYTYWRPLVIGSSSNATEGFSPSTATAGTYTFNTLEVQPSSGTIRMGQASMYNGSYTSKILPTTLTANRTITIPDASGTMALTNDIPNVPSPADATPLMDNATAAVGTSTNYAREDHVHPTDTSRAASIHAHGNITNDGDITASAPTITTGDQLIINDESASKVTNSGITFDTNVTTTYLRRDGTWATIPSDLPPQDVTTINKFLISNGTSGAAWDTLPKDIFWCTYNSTTFVEIQQAIENFHQLCLLNYQGKTYIPTFTDYEDIGGETYLTCYNFINVTDNEINKITIDIDERWSGPVSTTIPDDLPSQTGNSGKYLTTNGTAASWGTASATSTKSIDSAPTSSSSNLVTSGGVYTAINNKVNRTTAVNAADTNYTTLMARGVKLLDATTFDAVSNWSSELVNGAIAWRYE